MKKNYLIFALITVVLAASSLTVKGSEGDKVDYVPKVYGTVKAKFETGLYDGKMRFNVRNSRLGVKGNASRHINYNIQVDYNNEGKIGVLDAFIAYERETFGFTIGQHRHMFSSDLSRGPGQLIFANRSMLSKFITTYYGADTFTEDGTPSKYYVKSAGSRDLGFSGYYKLKDFPLKLTAGVFGGSGANNPEWTNSVNVVARLEYGSGKGFGAVISHFNGNSPIEEREYSKVVTEEGKEESVNYVVNNKHRMRMWNAEVSYTGHNYWLEGAYAQRRMDYDGLQLLSSAYLQGYYRFRLAEKYEMDYIAPTFRWDYGDDIEFINKSYSNIDRFTANRVTLGVNFGFTTKLVGAELRVNFEKYFLKSNQTKQAKFNPLLQDKISIELVATF